VSVNSFDNNERVGQMKKYTSDKKKGDNSEATSTSNSHFTSMEGPPIVYEEVMQ